jgi:hypothetical protein
LSRRYKTTFPVSHCLGGTGHSNGRFRLPTDRLVLTTSRTRSLEAECPSRLQRRRSTDGRGGARPNDFRPSYVGLVFFNEAVDTDVFDEPDASQRPGYAGRLPCWGANDASATRATATCRPIADGSTIARPTL